MIETRIGKIFISVWPVVLSVFLSAEEFSTARDFAEFQSNLGEQRMIRPEKRWIGPRPEELAPGVINLGLSKNKRKRISLIENTESAQGNKQMIEPVMPRRSQTQSNKDTFGSAQRMQVKPLQNWVGVRPEELAPKVIDLGSLENRRLLAGGTNRSGNSLSDFSSQNEMETEPDGLTATIFASTRPYHSKNVLRIDEGTDDAFVWENMIGASLAYYSVGLGKYLTMIPRLDFMMQVASYEDKDVEGANLADLLGYRFGLFKAGVEFVYQEDLSITFGYEYNILNNLKTGDRMSDALSPSVRLSKPFVISDRSLLLVDGSWKYANSDQVFPFPLPGQFADDGDNVQTGISLILIRSIGNKGSFLIMPSFSLTRTKYLRNENEGRVDWQSSFGLSASWQVVKWLNLEMGGNLFHPTYEREGGVYT